MERRVRPRRSVLYMPGSNGRALEKARTLPADALIFDLEDAVAPAGMAGVNALSGSMAWQRSGGWRTWRQWRAVGRMLSSSPKWKALNWYARHGRCS
jgi:hypothetical protein